MDIPPIVTDFGFPTALLLLILWAMRAVGKFLAPLVTQVAIKHVSLIDTLESNTVKQTEILENHTIKLDAIHDAVKPGIANP